MSEPTEILTAAILVIGDEILSGRTKDANVQTIAQFLSPYGIDVCEVRFVPDEADKIVFAVNQLRARASYLFTTGGIGPTHDDITADAIASAFNVAISERADALAILAQRYGAGELNHARRRMARIPDGALLIHNPVSGAPGFQLDNVFVMAGVPSIMRGMLEDVGTRLAQGAIVHTRTWRGVGLREGEFGGQLGSIARAHPMINLGSYPWFGPEGYGAHIVIRGRNLDAVEAGAEEVQEMIRQLGVQPEAI